MEQGEVWSPFIIESIIFPKTHLLKQEIRRASVVNNHRERWARASGVISTLSEHTFWENLQGTSCYCNEEPPLMSKYWVTSNVNTHFF